MQREKQEGDRRLEQLVNGIFLFIVDFMSEIRYKVLGSELRGGYDSPVVRRRECRTELNEIVS